MGEGHEMFTYALVCVIVCELSPHLHSILNLFYFNINTISLENNNILDT